MLQKAKEAIVSADSRTKGILAMAVVYVVIMLATVSSGAVNQITDFIPTVDIRLKDGLQEEKDYVSGIWHACLCKARQKPFN